MAEIKKQTGRMTDVSKPGSTAPSATSKPIIVSTKPAVSDSVINHDKKKELIPVTHEGLVLQPLEPSEKAVEPIELTKPPAESEPVSSGQVEVDVLADTVNEKSSKKNDEESELEQLRHIQKLAEQKTYFVKISDSSSGSPFAKIFVVLLIFVFVGALAANFLGDAEIINLPLDPLSNLL